MKNDWIETPTSVHELPWNIRAGKKVIWWVELEKCGDYPAKSFAIIGSLMQKHPQQEPYILDKENPGACSYFYKSVCAYKELDKGPYNE